MTKSTNIVELCGTAAAAPTVSHKGREETFYIFPLMICRLSGTADTINIIVRESLFDRDILTAGARLRVAGEVRSFNNKSGVGSKLMITVFAREVQRAAAEDEDKNAVELTGTLCRKPILRTTPLGREICDLMVAVNRKYGRSDYLPCITWGRVAQKASEWTVGTRIELVGRLQSRNYIKNIAGISDERTAFEISASQAELET